MQITNIGTWLACALGHGNAPLVCVMLWGGRPLPYDRLVGPVNSKPLRQCQWADDPQWPCQSKSDPIFTELASSAPVHVQPV